MNFSYEKNGILSRQRLNDIAKEIFRKSIHLCSAIVPFLLQIAYWPVFIALSVVVVLYCIFEALRLHGLHIPIISSVTAVAARKRDENRFVLGPVTLSIGILLTALLFDSQSARLGIFALAFGDGLASLAGKLCGRAQIPFTFGKTAEGSLTCFTAIFISSFLACGVAKNALILASIGMFMEVLPLKDFDNLFIPLVIAAVAHFFLL